jgi:hypothetical protein
MRRLVLFTVVLAFCVPSLFGREYEIPNFEEKAGDAKQQTPVWCWAASIQAILAHYGITRTQEDIVRATFGRVVASVAADPRQLYNALVNNRFTDSSLEITRGRFFLGSPSGSFLISEITANHPVILWYTNPGGGGHSVVAYGIEYDGSQNVSVVEYFDPWDGEAKSATRNDLAPRVVCYFAVRAASISPTAETASSEESEASGSAAEDISKDDSDQEWHETIDNPTVDYTATYRNTGTKNVRCKITIAVGTVPRGTSGRAREAGWQGVSSKQHSFTLAAGEEKTIKGTLIWAATPTAMPWIRFPDPSIARYPQLFQCGYTE